MIRGCNWKNNYWEKTRRKEKEITLKGLAWKFLMNRVNNIYYRNSIRRQNFTMLILSRRMMKSECLVESGWDQTNSHAIHNILSLKLLNYDYFIRINIFYILYLLNDNHWLLLIILNCMLYFYVVLKN